MDRAEPGADRRVLRRLVGDRRGAPAAAAAAVNEDREDRLGRIEAAIAALIIVSTSSANVNSYTLKCTASTGEPVADLTVDLDHRLMSWALPNDHKIIKSRIDTLQRYKTRLLRKQMLAAKFGCLIALPETISEPLWE